MHHLDEFVVTNFYELLTGRDSVHGSLMLYPCLDGLPHGLVFNAGQESLYDAQFNVGFEKRLPHFDQGRLYVVGG